MLTVGATDTMRAIASNTHTVVGVAQVLGIEPGDTWQDLVVISGTVTLNRPGDLPQRTCDVTVYKGLIPNGADDNTSDLTTDGSWIKLAHDVYAPTLGATATRVPLGVFSVRTLVIDELAGTIRITGHDSGQLVADYAIPTLSAGRFKPGRMFEDCAKQLIALCFENNYGAGDYFIPKWWSGETASVVPPLPTPPTLNATRQYEGSRVDAVTALVTTFGYWVKVGIDPDVDRQTPFLFVPMPDWNDVEDVKIRVTVDLEDMQLTETRDGVANVALVSYAQTIYVSGGETEDRDRRIVVELADGSNLRSRSPFGNVTQEVQSADVTTDAQAISLATSALVTMATRTDAMSVDCGPQYGIEIGDRVLLVLDAEQTDGVLAQVVGGTIPLTANDGGWSLNLESKTASPRRPPKVGITARDLAPSVDLIGLVTAAPAHGSVDMTLKTVTGWQVVNGSLAKNSKTTLRVTSNGAGLLLLRTPATFNVPATTAARPWVRIVFAVKSLIKGSAHAFLRAWGGPLTPGAATVYSDPATVMYGDTQTVTVDLRPQTAGTFSAGVEISGGTTPGVSPPTNLQQFEIVSARVYYRYEVVTTQ